MTSSRVTPVEKQPPARERSQKIGADADPGAKLFSLGRLEAGQFLDHDVTVGAPAPLEGPDPGAERRRHRVELLAVSWIGDLRWSVGHKLRLFRREHFKNRWIEIEPRDVGLRL